MSFSFAINASQESKPSMSAHPRRQSLLYLLSWKNHITDLSSRLNRAYYAIRTTKPFMSLDSMKMIYYSYVHSILSYGIIFWCNAPLSENIFIIQKRIIRVMSGAGRLDSCRELLKKLQILQLQSQRIFSLLLFVINIEIISYLILIFIILIHVLIIIYIYLLQIYQ
jgi:hypothetical protein